MATRVVKNVLFAVVATGLGLLVLEFGARGLRAALGWAPESGLSIPDRTLLWRMRPNFTGITHGTPVATNSLGLRGPEPRERSVSGRRRIRILIIGDSIAFGFGVPEESSWPRLLEDSLRTRWEGAGVDVEVVNGAVIGYGTFQEAAALRRLEPLLEPDLVIWQFCSNDIVENLQYAPHSVFRLLLDRSGLYNLGRDALLRAKGAEGFREVEGEEPPSAPPRKKGKSRRRAAQEEFGVIKEDAVFATDKPERLAEAWARTDAAAGEIVGTARESGTELLCVVFPGGTQVFADNRSTVLQDSVASLCGRRGVPVIDLLDRFRGQKKAYWVSHPTAEGNRLAAEVAVERLAPVLERLAARPAGERAR